MNIELAPEAYWKDLPVDEAILYCFSLNIDGKIGWRLPTDRERRRSTGKLHASWDQSDVNNPDLKNARYRCIPVRDLS